MVIDVEYTYCGNPFTISTNIKPLFCTPEIKIILCVNYISVKEIHGKVVTLKNGFYQS